MKVTYDHRLWWLRAFCTNGSMDIQLVDNDEIDNTVFLNDDRQLADICTQVLAQVEIAAGVPA